MTAFVKGPVLLRDRTNGHLVIVMPSGYDRTTISDLWPGRESCPVIELAHGQCTLERVKNPDPDPNSRPDQQFQLRISGTPYVASERRWSEYRNAKLVKYRDRHVSGEQR